MRSWHGEMVLDVDDVPELPNGTASVIHVRSVENREVRLATIDERGRLRELSDRRCGFIAEKWFVDDDVEQVEP